MLLFLDWRLMTTRSDPPLLVYRRRKHGKVVRAQVMTRLSQNLASPAIRGEAGLPFVMVSQPRFALSSHFPPTHTPYSALTHTFAQAVCPSRMAVGTSRGLVLIYDSQQVSP